MSRARTAVDRYEAGSASQSRDLAPTIMHVKGKNAVGARVFKVSLCLCLAPDPLFSRRKSRVKINTVYANTPLPPFAPAPPTFSQPRRISRTPTATASASSAS